MGGEWLDFGKGDLEGGQRMCWDYGTGFQERCRRFLATPIAYAIRPRGWGWVPHTRQHLHPHTRAFMDRTRAQQQRTPAQVLPMHVKSAFAIVQLAIRTREKPQFCCNYNERTQQNYYFAAFISQKRLQAPFHLQK